MTPRSILKRDFRGNFRRTATAVLTSLMLLLALVAFTSASAQAQAYTYSVLYRFTGTAGDGANPFGGVIRDSAGNLYGFTEYAGAGYGTVFKIDASGNETILHSFNLTDGSGPIGTPVMDAAGNIYGVTGAGGSLLDGVVFKLDPSGNLTVLYNIPYQSRAGLIIDAAGNLYGTTYLAGTFGEGNVFKLDPSGNVTDLHSFGGTPTDGILPVARLCQDAAGNLYGTTQNGGANSYGTVFKIDASGNYTVLHDFTNTDGAYPAAGLTLDTAGNLYGTAFDGGTSSIGTVFKLDTTGTLTVLHNFSGADGFHPAGELIRDGAGNLYGTTVQGGPNGIGTVFKLDTAGNLTLLHTFSDPTDGNEPLAGLFADAAGNFYSTATFGGSSANAGIVFKLAPSAALNNFTAQVIVDKDDHTTAVAGKFNSATSIDPTTQAVTLSVSGTNTFSQTFSPGAFKKKLGVYTASITSGSPKISMLLVPLSNGNWTYATAIRGFVPGSISVTVGLTIGPQSGSATVNALVTH